MKPIDPATLKDFAVEHINGEVEILIGSALHPALSEADHILERLAVEGVLGHARLFDDFLRLPADRLGPTCPDCGKELYPAPDDIVAQHYLPSWVPKGIFSAKERALINAQDPHLALRRQSGVEWDLGGIVLRVCDRLLAFIDQLRAADLTRAAWFELAYQRAAVVARLQRQHFETMERSTTTSTSIITVQGSFAGWRRAPAARP